MDDGPAFGDHLLVPYNDPSAVVVPQVGYLCNTRSVKCVRIIGNIQMYGRVLRLV